MMRTLISTRCPARGGALGVALLLITATLSAAAAAPTAERLTASPISARANWDYQLDRQGRLWVAYYDADKLLHVRDPAGAQRSLVPADRGQAPSGLEMAPFADDVAVLWRDKVPSKGIYLAAAGRTDAAPLSLGGKTEPLARVQALASGGRLHVLWYGEAKVADAADPYHLYYRQVDEKTFEPSEVERLMPGIYPLLTTDARGAVMAFSWLRTESPKRIVARFRAPGAGAFGDPVTVAEVPDITPIFRAFRSGSRWFVLWHAQYGEKKDDLLLEGAYSDDEGASWQRFRFKELRGFDVASLDIAADDDGHILIALSGNPIRRRSEKHNVHLARSVDRGASWTVSRLRPAGLLDGFHAKNPSVAFGPEAGQVLVVWEDWRNIRSGLYASFSSDYGATWTSDNVPLPHAANANVGLREDIGSVWAQGGRFNVIAEQFVDDSLQEKNLVRLQFTANDLAAAKTVAADDGSPPADAAAKKPSEAYLRQRVAAFWKAMVDGDYAATYQFQDPFFRARNTSIAYQYRMGRIQYHGYSIDDVRIEGPRATVKSKVKAEIKPFRASTGKTVVRPETEVPVTATWLWIDGDWYREFYSESHDLRYTKY